VIDILKLDESAFAWLFIPAVAGVVIGAFASGRLAGRRSPRATVKYGYALMLAAAAIDLGYNLAFAPAVPWAVLPLMLYSAGMSLAMPSISLLVLDLYPATRGLVASLQGFMQTMLNALVAGLVSPLLSHSAQALSLGMCAFVAAGGLVWLAYTRLHGTEAGHA